MPYRINPSYSYQYYHVYNRGNNRSNIFFKQRNYIYFLQKTLRSFSTYIELVAFCLMPNHYHLLVRVNEDKTLETAMQKIATGYTRAINKAYYRTGHLFEGRYKNKLIPGDEYLVHLCRYIHLNPVRAKLVNAAEHWEFSSYIDYLNKRDSIVLNKDILSNYFGSTEAFIDFHETYIEEQNHFVKDLIFE